MIYLYLKGKDIPFLCEFIRYILWLVIIMWLFIYYVNFKKLVFHFEKNVLIKNHFSGETVGCIKVLKTYLEFPWKIL